MAEAVAPVATALADALRELEEWAQLLVDARDQLQRAGFSDPPTLVGRAPTIVALVREVRRAVSDR